MQTKIRRRRTSAREARRELRRDAVNKRPVYAGLKGGAYKPLKPQDLEKIHHTALEVLETDYLYPDLADRSAMGIWEEEGSIDMMVRAQQSVKQVLSTHYPDHLEPKIDAAIRSKFPIMLAAADMKPGNGRW